jgi:hypothetical protein
MNRCCGQHLRLEIVVAQHQCGDVVGHFGEHRVALLFGQLAVRNGEAEQDLDVDLVIRRVDARRVVDRVGEDATARLREFDPPPLRGAEIAALDEYLAVEPTAVDAQPVVRPVADLRVRLGRRLDVGADAPVVDHVDRCLEQCMEEIHRRQRVGFDRERQAHLGRYRDRLRATGMDAAAGGDLRRVVVSP